MNLFFLIGIGGAVGFLSGLFGVGGGFLLTPLLIFSGVPSPVAIASVTGQVAAASTSGALSYYRRNAIDLHLALYLIMASTIGSMCQKPNWNWRLSASRAIRRDTNSARPDIAASMTMKRPSNTIDSDPDTSPNRTPKAASTTVTAIESLRMRCSAAA